MLTLKPKTATEAIGRWPGILQNLGVDPRYLENKHGPCPICGGKDRYRFDDKDGRGTWFCSQCGSDDGFGLLRRLHGWDFRQAAHEIDKIIGAVPAGPVKHERTDAEKLTALRKVWGASKAVTPGDPVFLYLRNRLGVEIIPGDIRFHPAMKYVDDNGVFLGEFPAMLAKLRNQDGESVSIHRTYLTSDGQKAAVPKVKKLMSGKSIKSACVRLLPGGVRLGIAEGIETALAASIRFGLPVWAATNATLLESWIPPVGVKSILIAADNDESFTGQASAYVLARRLVRDGYQVEVRLPATAGKDWADA